MSRMVAAAVAVLLAGCATSTVQPPLEIAITIDDLPVHAPYPPGITPSQVNAQMIAALTAAKVPAIGFVNGVGTEQHPETLQALRGWRDAGFPLGNHTWSHPGLSSLTIPQFEDELRKDDALLSGLGGNSDWRWFRYPFLDEGKDAAQRVAGRQVLAKYGYRVAAVTIGFSDWQYTGAYARCSAAHDGAAIAELERTYLASAKENIAVARETAHKLYGRDIRYVLLMHVSAMSAHMMPKVIELYRNAGFRFVSIGEAEGDPAYRGYTDLSLPPPSQQELAKSMGVTLPQATDYSVRLNAICPEGPVPPSP